MLVLFRRFLNDCNVLLLYLNIELFKYGSQIYSVIHLNVCLVSVILQTFSLDGYSLEANYFLFGFE